MTLKIADYLIEKELLQFPSSITNLANNNLNQNRWKKFFFLNVFYSKFIYIILFTLTFYQLSSHSLNLSCLFSLMICCLIWMNSSTCTKAFKYTFSQVFLLLRQCWNKHTRTHTLYSQHHWTLLKSNFTTILMTGDFHTFILSLMKN
jgi:hypothetical protein